MIAWVASDDSLWPSKVNQMLAYTVFFLRRHTIVSGPKEAKPSDQTDSDIILTSRFLYAIDSYLAHLIKNKSAESGCCYLLRNPFRIFSTCATWLAYSLLSPCF